MSEQLARELVELGAEIGYPATPSFTAWTEGKVPHSRRRRAYMVVAAAAALVVVLLAIPGPRTAIARFFGIGVVSFTGVEEQPDAPLDRQPNGAVVELCVAQKNVEFDLLTLSQEPDVVWLDESVAGGMVTLGYADSDSSYRLLITQMEGGTDLPAVEKLLSGGTVVSEVDVGGDVGFWVEGDPHVLLLFDRNGTVVEDSARLVGNTLVFVRDGVTVRIEGALNLDQALAVAGALSA